MTNLRCTAKLLRRFGVARPPDPPPGDNVLGDWYANILFLRDGHLLLGVSERGRLPVVAPARDLKSFPARFPRLVAEVLDALGVPPEVVAPERERMATVAFGPTRNRSILGTINDFGQILKWARSEPPRLSPLEWSLRLADAPCGPLGMRSPREAVVELFGAPPRTATEPPAPPPPSDLSEFERKRIERLFLALRDRRVPPPIRNKVDLVVRFEGASVGLYELRPSFGAVGKKVEIPIARFRKRGDGLWALYGADRNGRWRLFATGEPSRDVGELIAVVDADRTGLFWG